MGYNVRKALQSLGDLRGLASVLVWAALVLWLAYTLQGISGAGIVVLASGAAASISFVSSRRSRGGCTD